MKEIQFIRSPSQGNIYSSTRVGSVTLVGSGNYGRVLAHVNSTAFVEVPLCNIPHGSDIIAVDACQDDFYIIGVTFVHKTLVGIEEVSSSYLNFYTNWTSSDEPDRTSVKETLNVRQLEILGQRCFQFKLNFIPYHLYHCQVLKHSGIYENVFLLSGSDRRIHIYEPNYEGRSFKQPTTPTYFPELDGTFPSVVTRVQVEMLHSLKKRITICGCEDGQLKCFIVSESDSEIFCGTPSLIFSKDEDGLDSDSVFEEEAKHSEETPLSEASGGGGASGESCGDSLISSMNEDIQFGQSVQKFSTNFDGMITSIQIYADGCNVNVVVSSANSPVYLFTDTLGKLFGHGSCLKFSSRWDCVQTVCVADIDFDGKNEIIVGTFGCTLLVYKFMDDQVRQWVIVAHRKFPSAIYSVDFFDYHLYVLSASGLHIIEYTSEAYFYKHGVEPNAEIVRQYEEECKKKALAGNEKDKEEK